MISLITTPGLDFAPFCYFGRYRRESAPGRLAGPAHESAYTLIQVLDGTVDVGPSGRGRRLRPGQGAVLEPGTGARWRGGTLFVHLGFDLVPGPRRVGPKGHVEIPPGRRPQPPWSTLFGLPLPPRIDEAYLRRARARLHDLATTRSGHPLHRCHAHAELAGLVADWLLLLDADGTVAAAADRHLPDDLYTRLEALLMARHQEGITVAEAAALLGCTPEHLARSYRRARGTTPTRFLQRWRVHRACQLMREKPDRALNAIARDVGLAGTNSLNRAFHAVLGCAPSAWRKEKQ